jgi:hypothetical protein
MNYSVFSHLRSWYEQSSFPISWEVLITNGSIDHLPLRRSLCAADVELGIYYPLYKEQNIVSHCSKTKSMID